MKVKELRVLLSDFGEKQKLHRGQSQGRPSLASKDKLQKSLNKKIEREGSSKATSPTSSRNDTSPTSRLKDLPGGFSPTSVGSTEPAHSHVSPTKKKPMPSDPFLDEDSLALKANPSTDPTVATQDDRTTTTGDIPQPAASWDATIVSGGSWDNVDFPDPDPTFEYSPSSSFEDSIDESVQHASLRPDEYYTPQDTNSGIGVLGDMGQVHLDLLQKQSPILRNGNQVDRDEEQKQGTGEEDLSQAERNMHSANIFGNKTLTAGTLDLICNGGKIKRSYSLPDDVRDCFNDDSSSSLSNDSSTKPSIAPGALDSKMAQLLLDPHPLNEGIRLQAGYGRAPRSIPRCKKIDPKDLAFLNGNKPRSANHDMSDRPSSVSNGIDKFGGPKKTIVERRKEELEKLWAERKEAVHVKKVVWGVCQKTGMYKKKIVIEVQKK